MKLIEARPAGKSIVITGCARSGTTLLGTIIGSAHNAEYCFEQPALVSLFACFSGMDRSAWRLMYESILMEDFLLPTLAGRNVNLRELDDSSIYKTKTMTDIWRRQQEDASASKMRALAPERRIVWKLPDTPMLFAHDLLNMYPKTKILVCLRHPADVIASMIRKGWFRDNTGIWPKANNGGPWYFPKAHWIKRSELERAETHYQIVYGALLKQERPPQHIRVMEYGEWTAEPNPVLRGTFNWLGLEYGALTRQAISEVSPMAGHTDVKLSKKTWDVYNKVLEWGRE